MNWQEQTVKEIVVRQSDHAAALCLPVVLSFSLFVTVLAVDLRITKQRARMAENLAANPQPKKRNTT